MPKSNLERPWIVRWQFGRYWKADRFSSYSLAVAYAVELRLSGFFVQKIDNPAFYLE